MRILSITAGAAGMYCGSCLRDNALAAELIAEGHDVILLPLYTPTLTDEVFDRPDSFAWAGTVPEGWTTTPYVNYGSYAAFASDISAGEGPESTGPRA